MLSAAPAIQVSDPTSYRTPAPNLVQLSAAAERVLAAVRAADGVPLIVGGSVRDALIGAAAGRDVTSKDVDIEVYGLSDRGLLLSELGKVGRVDERGVSFGVIAVTVDGEDFDVSLPRRDSLTGTGHNGFTVQVDPDLDEVTAFGRRDFTINALGYDPTTGELVDPFNGAADLAAGVLRHTSDRFQDDPLRVLRGMQFAGRFGFTMADDTAELCRTMAERYPELSKERIWGEWRKLAQRGTHLTAAMTVLKQTGWLELHPELAALDGLQQDPTWHPEGDVYTHAGLAADAAATAATDNNWDDSTRELAVLGALLHDFGKTTHTQTHKTTGRITSHGHAEAGAAPATKFLNSIGAPQHLTDKIIPIIREHMSTASQGDQPTPTAVRKLIRRLHGNGNGPTIHDWAHVVDADHNGRGTGNKPSPTKAWLDLATVDGTKPARGLLRGEHLMAEGMVAGAAFAPILAASVVAQDEGVFEDEAGAVAWLREFLR